MPRGPKKKAPDFNGKIEAINEQIAGFTKKITALKAEKAELLAKQEEQDLKELSALLKSSGKSPAEIRAMLECGQ